MMELDTKVNSLTMARYVRSYGILLVEEKQSGNSWGFDTYTQRKGARGCSPSHSEH